MAINNTTTSWGWLSRLLHWLMAAMILTLLGVGFYMVNIATDLVTRYQLTQMHKSFGFVVFFLALLRIIWLWRNGQKPGLPEHMPKWQVTASHVSHKVLYILMFWMPLSGWLMASASPLNNPDAYPVQIKNQVFGLFSMPDPFPTGSDALMAPFHIAHIGGAIILALVLVVHVGAALKHHFIERDTILLRMLRG